MTPLAVDRLVLDTLKEVHNHGAAEYNAGDPAAAYRLYQGALLVVKALLAARPLVQKAVADGLDEVRQSPAEAALKAYRLHEIIEQVRAEIKADYQHRQAGGPPT